MNNLFFVVTFFSHLVKYIFQINVRMRTNKWIKTKCRKRQEATTIAAKKPCIFEALWCASSLTQKLKPTTGQ